MWYSTIDIHIRLDPMPAPNIIICKRTYVVTMFHSLEAHRVVRLRTERRFLHVCRDSLGPYPPSFARRGPLRRRFSRVGGRAALALPALPVSSAERTSLYSMHLMYYLENGKRVYTLKVGIICLSLSRSPQRPPAARRPVAETAVSLLDGLLSVPREC